MTVAVYDKVQWHYPEGEGCPSLDAALLHFRVILQWLSDRDLLSPLGLELQAIPLGVDSALTSDMVSDRGRRVLDEGYDTWLESVDYIHGPDTVILDILLRKAGQEV